MSAGPGQARIAVDIGGTFTDVVLEYGSRQIAAKVLTTASAPDDGVVQGVRDVLDAAGLGGEQVRLVIHGTTLATNAILERKGARTALITTEGFRDVLEIGYESRHDQYDLLIDKPAPLVPRELRLTVRERTDIHGRVLLALDEAGVASLAGELERLQVQSLAVGFLHAYANPAHERRTREILAGALPQLSISLSSEVCPEVREYERLTTTVANAYVRPLMARYLGRLERRLAEIGLACPLLLMTSGGGLTTLDTAMRLPIRLVESGPAGGAILASRIAEALGLAKVISFDMGGTTAKICLIHDHQPRTAREFEVDRAARFMKGSGLPLRIPVIEMVEIGAGGGSIARVDAMRRIAVGPDSAGAEPGPAAYGRGGENATVTDADVVLGRIDPARFAAGKVAIDGGRAREAVDRGVGRALDLATEMAAYGIAEMVDETMANAARVHAVEQGESVADHTLVAFGGAAPLHVNRLADKLGVRRIVVPAHAGVGSAVGFLAAPVAYEAVRSRHMLLHELDAPAANAVLEEMHAEALQVVRAGAPDAPVQGTRGAYMRYLGQGHEIFVALPGRALGEADRDALQQAFDAAYRALYRRTIPDARVEVLTWALRLAAAAPAAAAPSESAGTDAPAQAVGRRQVMHPAGTGTLEVPVYLRARLAPGAALRGPAIVAEDATSTFVGPGFEVTVTAGGHLLLERRDATDSREGHT